MRLPLQAHHAQTERLTPSPSLPCRNRYNAFCLADDLMEPFRPLVDY